MPLNEVDISDDVQQVIIKLLRLQNDELSNVFAAYSSKPVREGTSIMS